jgi:hypothetical protein
MSKKLELCHLQISSKNLRPINKYSMSNRFPVCIYLFCCRHLRQPQCIHVGLQNIRNFEPEEVWG